MGLGAVAAAVSSRWGSAGAPAAPIPAGPRAPHISSSSPFPLSFLSCPPPGAMVLGGPGGPGAGLLLLCLWLPPPAAPAPVTRGSEGPEGHGGRRGTRIPDRLSLQRLRLLSLGARPGREVAAGCCSPARDIHGCWPGARPPPGRVGRRWAGVGWRLRVLGQLVQGTVGALGFPLRLPHGALAFSFLEGKTALWALLADPGRPRSRVQTSSPRRASGPPGASVSHTGPGGGGGGVPVCAKAPDANPPRRARQAEDAENFTPAFTEPTLAGARSTPGTALWPCRREPGHLRSDPRPGAGSASPSYRWGNLAEREEASTEPAQVRPGSGGRGQHGLPTQPPDRSPRRAASVHPGPVRRARLSNSARATGNLQL